MDKVTMGARLKEARTISGLTQDQLAEKVGVNTSYISDVERGAKSPSMSLFIKIIDATNASADYVLRGEIEAGKKCVSSEIDEMLEPLTPKQRVNAAKVLRVYVETLE